MSVHEFAGSIHKTCAHCWAHIINAFRKCILVSFVCLDRSSSCVEDLHLPQSVNADCSGSMGKQTLANAGHSLYIDGLDDDMQLSDINIA